jgi:hypothetical protein
VAPLRLSAACHDANCVVSLNCAWRRDLRHHGDADHVSGAPLALVAPIHFLLNCPSRQLIKLQRLAIMICNLEISQASVVEIAHRTLCRFRGSAIYRL